MRLKKRNKENKSKDIGYITYSLKVPKGTTIDRHQWVIMGSDGILKVVSRREDHKRNCNTHKWVWVKFKIVSGFNPIDSADYICDVYIGNICCKLYSRISKCHTPEHR